MGQISVAPRRVAFFPGIRLGLMRCVRGNGSFDAKMTRRGAGEDGKELPEQNRSEVEGRKALSIAVMHFGYVLFPD